MVCVFRRRSQSTLYADIEWHLLLHRLDHGFDEILVVGDAVLGVELLVDVGNRLRPVDVGRRGEVLKGDEAPLL